MSRCVRCCRATCHFPQVANFKPRLMHKSNKRKRGAAADAGGVQGAASVDPLRAVGGGTSGPTSLPVGEVKGFARAQKRGDGSEEMTEMERRATALGKKQAKARLKAEGGVKPAAVFKQNVKKRGGVIRRR